MVPSFCNKKVFNSNFQRTILKTLGILGRLWIFSDNFGYLREIELGGGFECFDVLRRLGFKMFKISKNVGF